VPLTVDFRFPEDRLRVSDEASVVAAVVTSSKGVAKISVTLNGAEVFQQSERTPQRSMAVAETLKLREGMNVIVLSASEPDGTCVRSCAPSSTSGPRWPRLRPWSRPAWCRHPWSRAAGPW